MPSRFHLPLVCWIVTQTLGAAEIVLPERWQEIWSIAAMPGAAQSTSREQQVYPAETFSHQIPDGALITDIAFRADYSVYHLSQVQIELSTTSRDGGSLSPVFSMNVGRDRTIVYGPKSNLDELPGNQEPGLWRSHFHFDVPFAYFPRDGNLLLDIKILSKDFAGWFGFSQSPADGMAVAWSPDVNAATALQVSTGGWITRFTFQPIPEPSMDKLIFVGLLIMLWVPLNDRRKAPLPIDRKRA